MYVVKVGEYYVKSFVGSEGRIPNTIPFEIKLSKELMTGYPLEIAERIAKKLNGEVIEMSEEVTNE